MKRLILVSLLVVCWPDLVQDKGFKRVATLTAAEGQNKWALVVELTDTWTMVLLICVLLSTMRRSCISYWLELTSLCQQLHQRGLHITIETNGTLFQQVEADLLSISPKLANSNPATSNHHFQQHQRLRINQPVLRQFLDQYNCQLKFVVETEPDLVEIQQLQQEMQIPSSTIVLMPQGITSDQIQGKQNWMVEICKQHGYRYSPRLQVDIWGDKRGT